jgi:hypothetical protein
MAAYSCGGSCGIGDLPAPHSRFTFVEGTDDNCKKAQCGRKFKPNFASNKRISCLEFGSQAQNRSFAHKIPAQIVRDARGHGLRFMSASDVLFRS